MKRRNYCQISSACLDPHSASDTNLNSSNLSKILPFYWEQLLPKSKAALQLLQSPFHKCLWQDASQSLSNARPMCVQWVELLRTAPHVPTTSLPSFPIPSHTYDIRIFVARGDSFSFVGFIRICPMAFDTDNKHYKLYHCVINHCQNPK